MKVLLILIVVGILVTVPKSFKKRAEGILDWRKESKFYRPQHCSHWLEYSEEP